MALKVFKETSVSRAPFSNVTVFIASKVILFHSYVNQGKSGMVVIPTLCPLRKEKGAFFFVIDICASQFTVDSDLNFISMIILFLRLKIVVAFLMQNIFFTRQGTVSLGLI